jgi:hypothetical protein
LGSSLLGLLERLERLHIGTVLVAGFSGGGGLGGEVSFGQLAVEEVEDEAVEAVGEFGIVAEAFVAHESVGSVDLVPAEAGAKFVESGEDLHAAFEGDVGVLTAPDHEEFPLDVFGALEGVVVHALAEAAFVDVGGVEAGGGRDVGVHGGAEGEVAADADAHGAEVAGAVGAGFEVVEDGSGVGVVGCDWLGGLEFVAAVGAGLVVGEDGAGGFELVVDLGHGDDVAVAGEHGGGAVDGGGDLEDLRVEDDSGVAAGGGGADDVGAHGTAGSVECDVLVVDDDHGRLGESVRYPPLGAYCAKSSFAKA